MKWISVNDALPKLDKECLVITEDSTIETAIYQNSGTRKQSKFEWYSLCCHGVEDVTHWVYIDEIEKPKE